jgi:hypothetical protein
MDIEKIDDLVEATRVKLTTGYCECGTSFRRPFRSKETQCRSCSKLKQDKEWIKTISSFQTQKNSLWSNPEASGLRIVLNISATNLDGEHRVLCVWQDTKTRKLLWAFDIAAESGDLFSAVTVKDMVSLISHRDIGLRSAAGLTGTTIVKRNEFYKDVQCLLREDFSVQSRKLIRELLNGQ